MITGFNFHVTFIDKFGFWVEAILGTYARPSGGTALLTCRDVQTSTLNFIPAKNEKMLGNASVAFCGNTTADRPTRGGLFVRNRTYASDIYTLSVPLF